MHGGLLIGEEARKTARALREAGKCIIAVALVHVLALAIAAVMVHAGYEPALAYRDKLVGQARQSDPVSQASRRGENVRAGLVESARTQWICVAVAVTGLTVVTPFILAAYRGWVGGVVSVDDRHASRLRHGAQAVYYLSVIALQIIPYAIAGGAGVRLGLTYFRRERYEGGYWLGYPKEGLWNLVRILISIIPLVLIANLWEFLSPLNR